MDFYFSRSIPKIGVSNRHGCGLRRQTLCDATEKLELAFAALAQAPNPLLLAVLSLYSTFLNPGTAQSFRRQLRQQAGHRPAKDLISILHSAIVSILVTEVIFNGQLLRHISWDIQRD